MIPLCLIKSGAELQILADAGGEYKTRPLANLLGGAAQQRDVVAQQFAEPAGFEKIALHIDNHQRRRIRFEGKRIGFGLERMAYLIQIYCPPTVRFFTIRRGLSLDAGKRYYANTVVAKCRIRFVIRLEPAAGLE